MASRVPCSRLNGSRWKSLWSATPAATDGWASCINNARPPPSSSTPSPLTLRITASRGKSPAIDSGRCHSAVQRRPLFERPAKRLDDRPEAVLVHHLAVGCPGGTGDVLVHQRAAQIVAPRLQQLRRPFGADLHPRGLDVVDPTAVRDAADGVHQ